MWQLHNKITLKLLTKFILCAIPFSCLLAKQNLEKSFNAALSKDNSNMGPSIKQICTKSRKIDPLPFVRKMSALDKPPSPLVHADTPKISKVFVPKSVDVRM